MILASYRFFADLRHHGRTRDGNARRQTYESANGPWRPPPLRSIRTNPKGKSPFVRRPRRHEAPESRGGPRRAAGMPTRPQGAVGFRVIVSQKQL